MYIEPANFIMGTAPQQQNRKKKIFITLIKKEMQKTWGVKV